MSKEQLLESYLRGEISRRRFIHGLAAGGVSVSAITDYSGLVPQRALAASGSYDLRDETEPPPARAPAPPQAGPPPAAPAHPVRGRAAPPARIHAAADAPPPQARARDRVERRARRT